MHRIGGRLGDTSFGMYGADVGIPLFCYWNSNIEAVNRHMDSVRRTV